MINVSINMINIKVGFLLNLKIIKFFVVFEENYIFSEWGYIGLVFIMWSWSIYFYRVL